MSYNFYVVAVGSSAGGQQPLQSLLSLIPIEINAAIVVVTHLLPTSKSILPQILSGFTRMPIHRAANGMQIRPGEVYVLPENAMMTIEDGILLLRERLPTEKINCAVDIFFKSLGADAGEKAIAVILSGANNDGSEGANLIKENGGEVYVQEPATAQYPQMPTEAILNDSPKVISSAQELINKILKKPGILTSLPAPKS